MAHPVRRLGWMLGIVALLATAGCATTPAGKREQQDTIRGAFVSPDKLYLLGDARDYELDPAPFHAYHALVDSPLRDAVVCARMHANVWLGHQGVPDVAGVYALLLDAGRVDPTQADAFKLERIEVTTAADPRQLPYGYRLAADPACDLPKGPAQFYAVQFYAQGRTVRLQDREALLAASALPQPVPLDVQIKGNGPGHSGPLASVGALVTAPVHLIGILFTTKDR